MDKMDGMDFMDGGINPVNPVILSEILRGSLLAPWWNVIITEAAEVHGGVRRIDEPLPAQSLQPMA